MKHIKYLLTGAVSLGVPVLLGVGIAILYRIAPAVGISLIMLLVLVLMYKFGKKISNGE